MGGVYVAGKPTTGDRIHVINEHLHGRCYCYPTLAADINVSDGGSSWAEGSLTQIVAAGVITMPFDIHYLSVSAVSNKDLYELSLYYGDTDIECGRIRFARDSNQYNPPHIPFMTPLLPAGSRIRAKLASLTGGFDADISVFYHMY